MAVLGLLDPEVLGGALAAAAEGAGVAAGGEDALDRPARRLGVDGAVAAEREAATGALGAPGTSPQPPSSFWTSCSQESDFSRPPVAPAVRRATTAKAVEPGQPS